MIIISKARKTEELVKEWKLFTVSHYGNGAKWQEKNFRFKAVENGKLLGTVEGKLEGDVIYIATLMTTKSARQKGIGTMLIEKAEKFGQKLGARKTWLLVGINWPANTFYQKLGFKQIATIPDLYFHKDFFVYTRHIK